MDAVLEAVGGEEVAKIKEGLNYVDGRELYHVLRLLKGRGGAGEEFAVAYLKHSQKLL